MLFTFSQSHTFTEQKSGVLKSPTKQQEPKTVTNKTDSSWFKEVIGKNSIDEELIVAEAMHLAKQKDIKTKVEQMMDDNLPYQEFHKIMNDDILIEKVA